MKVSIAPDRVWSNKKWQKGLRSLSPRDRERVDRSIERLAAALMSSSHPTSDPKLRPWNPGRWSYHSKNENESFCEYRLRVAGNRVRVVGLYDSDRDELLLVTRTAKHSHDDMKSQVERFLRERRRA